MIPSTFTPADVLATAVVVAAADAVAVGVTGDADVVVAPTDAAVAAGAAGEAEVALGVADELVRAGALPVPAAFTVFLAPALGWRGG